jgi:amidase
MDHTIDHIGPITRTVADNALMLEVMAGADWRDPQWARGVPQPEDVPAYTAMAGQSVAGMKIGVIREALAPIGCTPDVLAAFDAACAQLTGLGAEVVEVSVPLWADAWAIESATILFGLHAMAASGGQGIGHLGRIDVETLAAQAAQARLGARDLPPFLQIALVTVEHLRDCYLGVHFGKGQNLRLELRRQVAAALDGVDLLATPTIPTVPFELLDRPASDAEMAERMGLGAVSNTCPLDLTGSPALTLPCGTGEHGLPVGLQLIGRHFDEQTVYRAAFAFEAAGGELPAAAAASTAAAGASPTAAVA